MNAIQFETVVKDDTIHIPEQYRRTLRRGKVQVTILDQPVSENRNGKAWLKFLQNLKNAPCGEPIEFERVDFDRKITL
ncbi:MAG: hypothetical protein LBL36_05055 [Clostridiales Family XIII bacterium]|jgi:hypothetical protein|nr:hypothetical protein [Clostridiales Family XIII bacterium]